MKLSGVLFAMILAVAFAGCSGAKPKSDQDMKKADTAQTVSAPATEKPEFDGHCAMGVCHGKFNVKGDPQFKLERDGKIYYFSDEAAKVKFEKNYAKNVKKAEKRWHEFVTHGGPHAQ